MLKRAIIDSTNIHVLKDNIKTREVEFDVDSYTGELKVVLDPDSTSNRRSCTFDVTRFDRYRSQDIPTRIMYRFEMVDNKVARGQFLLMYVDGVPEHSEHKIVLLSNRLAYYVEFDMGVDIKNVREWAIDHYYEILSEYHGADNLENFDPDNLLIGEVDCDIYGCMKYLIVYHPDIKKWRK